MIDPSEVSRKRFEVEDAVLRWAQRRVPGNRSFRVHHFDTAHACWVLRDSSSAPSPGCIWMIDGVLSGPGCSILGGSDVD